MKFIDLYFNYKRKYEKAIIIYRIGNFYNVLGVDALILNDIFNYQVQMMSGEYKVGFPIMSLERIVKELKHYKINTIVVEKIDGIVQIVQRNRVKENHYETYKENIKGRYERKNRIEKIYKELLEKVEKDNFEEYIKKIEACIYE